MLGGREVLQQLVAVGVAVELVGGEGPQMTAFGKGTLLSRHDGIHGGTGGNRVVEAFREARLMLGEPQRHDADVQDTRARVRPIERLAKRVAVVLVGHEHDLGVELDAGGKQAVHHLDAVLGVAADDAAANLGVGCVQGNAQRADVLLDDARLVGGRQVGERDERSRQKAEAEVVVAQGQRGTHVVGQLSHEAEDAGVAALLDAVEHHAGELEAPLLALVALKLHLAGVSVGVDVAEGDHVVGGKPAPVDHVAHGLAVHAGDDAARREARVVGRAFGQHGFDDGLRRLGSTAFAAARGLRSLLRHILRRINAHVNTAFPLPLACTPSIFRSISW